MSGSEFRLIMIYHLKSLIGEVSNFSSLYMSAVHKGRAEDI